jgi:hypothetical protein
MKRQPWVILFVPLVVLGLSTVAQASGGGLLTADSTLGSSLPDVGIFEPG